MTGAITCCRYLGGLPFIVLGHEKIADFFDLHLIFE